MTIEERDEMIENRPLLFIWMTSMFGIGGGVGKVLDGTRTPATAVGIAILTYVFVRVNDLLHQRGCM